MLELKNISKYYNAGTVNEMCLFNDFNLSIDDGEFVSVVGSNGSGKTSMLNLICGSIPVDSGTIVMGGTDITKMPEYKRQRRIGRVYQHPAMGTCPNMTILENMALADNKGKPFNLLPGTNKARIDFYRDQLKILGLGLEDKMGVKVGVLSGGQRQAMALLMSTMTPIEFLILDEPTSSLDDDEVAKLFKLMNRLKDEGVGIIFVTHFLEQVYEVCDRITVLRNGELVGEYEVKDLPRVMLVAKMMGKDFDDLADIKGDHKVLEKFEPVIEAEQVGRKGSIKPFDFAVNKGEVVGLTGFDKFISTIQIIYIHDSQCVIPHAFSHLDIVFYGYKAFHKGID